MENGGKPDGPIDEEPPSAFGRLFVLKPAIFDKGVRFLSGRGADAPPRGAAWSHAQAMLACKWETGAFRMHTPPPAIAARPRGNLPVG